ncbi:MULTISPECIES: DUF4184 family protein [Pseudonocardia]|uniref:DUF4184 domain-containing protein n=2 Tax=Pseudonocardia TaxID=1847 RepID=A0A1Y2MH47_PSEAH|nr:MULTISPECIES: DUF4184 family protein [Pseudonocardia]OSY34580.1 hypothetical protein BG845_06712 [Pseudonocardia autotrophica]TDN71839.1 uncharacterized protein DUF4184 [Pseudonocardia autotrophica]BBG02527.1 hypothetical protein Pdca_37360 [Pseudonocardia autotrophica]GEC29427.1 hypothetical protein PSA01_64560 [Pseudonocardia saturnea]
MPFTLVHPAAVLPLLRTGLVPSALVAGAVAPDLPYYVRLTAIHGNLNLTLTHGWSSLLWLNPIIGLALLAIFHALLKRPLADLAPPALACRIIGPVAGFRWRSPAAAALVVGSVAVGATTHLGWDALGGVAGPGWSGPLTAAGNLAGTVALGAWFVCWWRTAPRTPGPAPIRPTRRFRIAVTSALVAVPVTAGATAALAAAPGIRLDLQESGGYDAAVQANLLAREFAVTAVGAAGVAVLGYALIRQGVRATRQRIGPTGQPGGGEGTTTPLS